MKNTASAGFGRSEVQLHVVESKDKIYFSQVGDGLTNFRKISLYQTFSQCSDEAHSE